MKIAGKVALITGGTGGFGKAFAKALLNGNAAAVSNLELDFIGLFHFMYIDAHHLLACHKSLSQRFHSALLVSSWQL